MPVHYRSRFQAIRALAVFVLTERYSTGPRDVIFTKRATAIRSGVKRSRTNADTKMSTVRFAALAGQFTPSKSKRLWITP